MAETGEMQVPCVTERMAVRGGGGGGAFSHLPFCLYVTLPIFPHLSVAIFFQGLMLDVALVGHARGSDSGGGGSILGGGGSNAADASQLARGSDPNDGSDKGPRGAGISPSPPSPPTLKVAIEVDGPCHFVRGARSPNGRTLLKRRLLTKLGWHLVSVPYWEWDQVTAALPRIRREYLCAKLDGLGPLAMPIVVPNLPERGDYPNLERSS